MQLWELVSPDLQGRLAGWRPREELMVYLESKGSLEAEFFLSPGYHGLLGNKDFDL